MASMNSSRCIISKGLTVMLILTWTGKEDAFRATSPIPYQISEMDKWIQAGGITEPNASSDRDKGHE